MGEKLSKSAWVIIIMLICSLIGLSVFITGKNLPDYWNEDPSSNTEALLPNQNSSTDESDGISSDASSTVGNLADLKDDKNVLLNTVAVKETISETQKNSFSLYGEKGIKYKISLSEGDYTSETATYKVLYSLNGKYNEFNADVLMQSSRQASVLFSYVPLTVKIVADGEVLYEMGLDGQSSKATINIAAKNIDLFEIHITTGFEQLRVGGGDSYDEVILDNAVFTMKN